ncbi:MAG: carboxypeptidase-like regulatory domain-containing protein [Acidobacteriota bacterium]
MLKEKIFHSRVLVWGLASAFLSLLLPVEALAQARGTGSLIGFIYAEALARPVENAVVKIRNLSTRKEFMSKPTDKTGLYKIENVEEGRYVLGVTTPQGDFNFEFELFIKAGEIAKLSLALKPGLMAALAVPFKAALPFFKTPLGIVTTVVVSGLAIYGGYKLLEELEVISPSKK